MPRTRPRRPTRRLPAARRPARLVWQIDMGDGTYAACCMACSLPLYRGWSKGAARQAADNHRCEPVVPLRRRGGRR